MQFKPVLYIGQLYVSVCIWAFQIVQSFQLLRSRWFCLLAGKIEIWKIREYQRLDKSFCAFYINLLE